jgi:hypothetical protein
MIGLFGPQRLGKVFSYANQYVETTFLILIIPLSSYFVDLNSKSTIQIPLNKVSLKNHYFSFSLILSGVLFFVLNIVFGLKFSENEANLIIAYAPITITMMLVSVGFIYYFISGRHTKYEIKKRTILQNVVGINALPEWLDDETAKFIYEKHINKLPDNWKDKIATKAYTTEEFFYYYTMLAYQQRIMPTSENVELFNKLDMKLNK